MGRRATPAYRGLTMAQRIFAPANDPEESLACLAPVQPGVEMPALARRAAPSPEPSRAEAYLDLWERQLLHAAAFGPRPPAAGQTRT